MYTMGFRPSGKTAQLTTFPHAEEEPWRLTVGQVLGREASHRVASQYQLQPIRIAFQRYEISSIVSRVGTDLSAANNFDGNSLMECDQKILQEMGIKKIGDRVRIFVAIKQLRNKSVANRKQKNMVSGDGILCWARITSNPLVC